MGDPRNMLEANSQILQLDMLQEENEVILDKVSNPQPNLIGF